MLHLKIVDEISITSLVRKSKLVLQQIESRNHTSIISCYDYTSLLEFASIINYFLTLLVITELFRLFNGPVTDFKVEKILLELRQNFAYSH